MKRRLLLLIFFLTPLAVTAQNPPLLQPRGEVSFADRNKELLIHQPLGQENRMLFVGDTAIKILDLTNMRVTESQLGTSRLCEDRERLISPDGRRMIIFGNYSCTEKKDKIKRPAAVWDLETGKQLTVLDRTARPVRVAQWSKNGKTLITSSEKYHPAFTDSASAEVAFWDGEMLALKNSLPDEQVNWWYLSHDGSACFYSLGPVKTLLFIEKYLGQNGGPLKTWDVNNGRVQETINAIQGSAPRKIRAIEVSPDEEFLTFLAQPPKSKEIERRQVVVDIEKMNHASYALRSLYEIKPAPHLAESGAAFSDDGKYFALRAKKNLQIYETKTGDKKFELVDVKSLPSRWLADNKILLFDYSDKMEAIEIATAKLLYKQELVYDVFQATDSDDSMYWVTSDSTTILVHPERNLLLTYSKQYVKVIDSISGELLQTLVAPAMDYSKKKPRLSSTALVSKAGWSADGKSLFIVDYDKKTISVWRFEN